MNSHTVLCHSQPSYLLVVPANLPRKDVTAELPRLSFLEQLWRKWHNSAQVVQNGETNRAHRVILILGTNINYQQVSVGGCSSPFLNSHFAQWL